MIFLKPLCGLTKQDLIAMGPGVGYSLDSRVCLDASCNRALWEHPEEGLVIMFVCVLVRVYKFASSNLICLTFSFVYYYLLYIYHLSILIS